MENEEDPQKQTSDMTSSSSNQPDNNPDLTLAMSLHQWSDDDDESSQTDEEETDFDYEQYSTSQDVEDVAELGFLEEEEEEEGGGSESEMEEDEIDPDEMSYEELMELGETIGAAEERGLSTDKISLCLKPTNYPVVITGCKDQCVVCQIEYEEGEPVVGLLCKHMYHAECITQWLRVKKTCPVCNMEISPPQSSTTVEDVAKKKI